ncbi:MAG: D-aminoacyl-tRNA deacylase [Firmicutes bacterium]|nr:D-aminoacyl-tRNA deacylase [Bacillota bacterium]
MKIVLQRVNCASVSVEDKTVGKINKGYLVFLGIINSDTKITAEKAVDKIFRLRIFADECGKTNLSVSDVKGGILVISQFTLCAELTQNRPSFSSAASKEHAIELYDHFIDVARGKFKTVQSGQFGAHMVVYASNDGPFTLTFDIND